MVSTMMDENGSSSEKTAKIFAIIGLCGSLLSIIYIFLNYFYAPFCILFLFAYTLAFIGIKKKRSRMLLFAQIMIGINVVIHVVISINYLVLGITLPQDIVDKEKKPTESENEAKMYARITFFVLAFIVLLIILYNICAIFVFQRVRSYFCRNTFNYNSSNSFGVRSGYDSESNNIPPQNSCQNVPANPPSYFTVFENERQLRTYEKY